MLSMEVRLSAMGRSRSGDDGEIGESLCTCTSKSISSALKYIQSSTLTQYFPHYLPSLSHYFSPAQLH